MSEPPNGFHRSPLGKEVVVAAARRGLEEQWLCSALDADGIPYRVDGLSEVLGIPRVRIWVREADEERARAALEAADRATGPDGTGPDEAEPDETEPEGGFESAAEESRPERTGGAARVAVLFGGLWYLALGLFQWTGGARLEGGFGILAGAAFVVLWKRSLAFPARAFAGAAVLGTGLFLLLVAGSFVEPKDPAPLAEVAAHALFVLLMYGAAKRAARDAGRGRR